MRMVIKHMGTIGPGHFPMHTARGGHIALHSAINSAFIPPAGSINSPPHRHYICLGSPGSCIMEASSLFDELSDTLCGCMVPLGGACLVHCAEPSTRTVTGRRCSLYSCIEFSPDAHFSNIEFFPGASTAPQQTSSPSVTPTHPGVPQIIPNSFAASAPLQTHESLETVPTMPRLRQRMTARQGGTRGSSVGEHPSSSRHFSEIPSISTHGRPPASLPP